MLRIIPRIDIKGTNLVKGINFEGLRSLGNPCSFAKFYYEKGADELMFVDVVSSLYNQRSSIPEISQFLSRCLIPCTAAGGIKTNKDIEKALLNGFDRVSINSEYIKNPSILKEISSNFGSSTIAIGVDVLKVEDKYKFCSNYGKLVHDKELINYLQSIEDNGAGEIFLTSVDKDGTMNSPDMELIKKVSSAISIPITYGGGISSAQDIADIYKFGIDSVSISSLLHYATIKYILEEEDINPTNKGNRRFLNNRRSSSNMIKGLELSELKKQLDDIGIPIRLSK